MNQNIKNFIEEGEKEDFESFWTYRMVGQWSKVPTTWDILKNIIKLELLDWHKQRQISLIKMIVEMCESEDRYELGGYPADEGAYMEQSEDGEYIKIDTISSKLKELIS